MGDIATRPISPDEAKVRHWQEMIPDEVFQVVNRMLISRGFDNITLKQDDIVLETLELMEKNGKEVTRREIYDKHWLDIEKAYEQAGWDVEYHKPHYGENYGAYFVFRYLKS